MQLSSRVISITRAQAGRFVKSVLLTYLKNVLFNVFEIKEINHTRYAREWRICHGAIDDKLKFKRGLRRGRLVLNSFFQ